MIADLRWTFGIGVFGSFLLEDVPLSPCITIRSINDDSFLEINTLRLPRDEMFYDCRSTNCIDLIMLVVTTDDSHEILLETYTGSTKVDE